MRTRALKIRDYRETAKRSQQRIIKKIMDNLNILQMIYNFCNLCGQHSTEIVRYKSPLSAGYYVVSVLSESECNECSLNITPKFLVLHGKDVEDINSEAQCMKMLLLVLFVVMSLQPGSDIKKTSMYLL